MLNKHKDIGAGFMLMLIGLVLFLSAQTIPRGAAIGAGPGFMPKVMALLLAIVGIIIAFQGYLAARQQVPEAAAKTEDAPVKPGNIKAVVLSLLCLLLYTLLMEKIGFIITTMLYVFLQTMIMMPKEKRNYLVIGIISVVTSVAVYLIFTQLFVLMLPAGILG